MQMRQVISRFSIPLSLCFFIAAMGIGGSSCKKEQLLQSGGELRFSTDTLTFDTVFTSLGSATVGVKIFNPQNGKDQHLLGTARRRRIVFFSPECRRQIR